VPRKLTRIGLIAMLMLGVIAMHSFGHTGHSDHGQIVVTDQSAHHGHAMDADPPPTQDDAGPSALLSALGLMVCGAILARIAFECFRSAAWSRLWDRLIAALEQLGRGPAQRWLPPPRLQPSGVQVNRIAVLRI
jgi:hypothetical protein